MSYFNPIYKYGIEQFVNDLKATPVKGLILPDVPGT
jgi:tryptophan synthase alpha chain